jgi:hypothetical protein
MPTGLVVKKGSKTFPWRAGSIPTPSSQTSISIAPSAALERTTTFPPGERASMALKTRFWTTMLILAG